jgi:hypothetical protein
MFARVWFRDPGFIFIPLPSSSLPLILVIRDPNIAREFAHGKNYLLAACADGNKTKIYIPEGSPGVMRVIHRKRRTQGPFGGRIQLLPPDAAEPIPLRKEIQEISIR